MFRYFNDKSGKYANWTAVSSSFFCFSEWYALVKLISNPVLMKEELRFLFIIKTGRV
jgi:hypothetical protein